MMQISYEFYSQTYGGTEVPEAVFDQFAYRAGILVGNMIRGGQVSDEDKLKRLHCEICDRLYREDRRPGISRESLDGYDVTYCSGEAVDCELRQLVRQYIGDDGVLFRGRRL